MYGLVGAGRRTSEKDGPCTGTAHEDGAGEACAACPLNIPSSQHDCRDISSTPTVRTDTLNDPNSVDVGDAITTVAGVQRHNGGRTCVCHLSAWCAGELSTCLACT